MKLRIRNRLELGPGFALDILLLLLAGYLTYESMEWLVSWVMILDQGFIGEKNLGWLSGWLMVIPNALMVFYYAYKKRADIAYSSQIGDGHICIPLCIGLFAILKPIDIPKSFEIGIQLIVGAAFFHLLFVILLGRMPRWAGLMLASSYFYFIYKGLIE